MDLESRKRSEVKVHGGQRVTILPLCAHRFTAEEDAQVIEYYDCSYDPDDDLRFDDF